MWWAARLCDRSSKDAFAFSCGKWSRVRPVHGGGDRALRRAGGQCVRPTNRRCSIQTPAERRAHPGRRFRLRVRAGERRDFLPNAAARSALRRGRAVRAVLCPAALHAHARATSDRSVQRSQLHAVRRDRSRATDDRAAFRPSRLRDGGGGQVAARSRQDAAAQAGVRRVVPVATHAPAAAVRQSGTRVQRRAARFRQRRIRAGPGERFRPRFHRAAQGPAVLPVLPDAAHAWAVSTDAARAAISGIGDPR